MRSSSPRIAYSRASSSVRRSAVPTGRRLRVASRERLLETVEAEGGHQEDAAEVQQGNRIGDEPSDDAVSEPDHRTEVAEDRGRPAEAGEPSELVECVGIRWGG